MDNKIKKLLLVLVILSLATLAYSWTGTNQKVKLVYPKGSGQTTQMYLPSSVYGVIANDLTAVDYNVVSLYDTVLLDTVFVDTLQDHNSLTYGCLLSGVIIRKGIHNAGSNNIIYGRKYLITLKGVDISSGSFTDTGYVYFLPRGENE